MIASVALSVLSIVGGDLDPGDPAVAALVTSQFPYCTGSLVAPNVILTAGHCIEPAGASADYVAYFGSDVTQPTRRVAIAEQRTHPSFTGEGKAFDFGMVRLAVPVTDFVPLKISAATLDASVVGQPIRHVGFGVADEATGDGRGVKRTTTYPITQLDPEVVWSGSATSQTCGGDSGAPGFIGDEIAAVVSDGPNCHDAGWDGRVDVAKDWIDATLAEWNPDTPDTGNKAGCAEAPGGLALGLAVLAFALARRHACRLRAG